MGAKNTTNSRYKRWINGVFMKKLEGLFINRLGYYLIVWPT